MPRKFSIINVGDTQLVKSGFVEPDSLAEFQEVVDIIYNTSIYEKVELNIQHVLFLDFPEAETEDATEVEVDILKEKLKELYELSCLQLQEKITLEEIWGLLEEKLVEKIE